MIIILGLKKHIGRLGHDAEDEYGRKFELKSTTTNSFGTARDVSVEMINGRRVRYWVFAKGVNHQDGFDIETIHLCTPAMMKTYFDQLESKFKPDITIQNMVLKQVKKVLNKTQFERLVYLLNRGMTYNNPKISIKYVTEHGVKIDITDPKNSIRVLKTYK